jgi:hypothetical protein
VWVFVAMVRKVNLRIGLGVARGVMWSAGFGGYSLARRRATTSSCRPTTRRCGTSAWRTRWRPLPAIVDVHSADRRGHSGLRCLSWGRGAALLPEASYVALLASARNIRWRSSRHFAAGSVGARGGCTCALDWPRRGRAPWQGIVAAGGASSCWQCRWRNSRAGTTAWVGHR